MTPTRDELIRVLADSASKDAPDGYVGVLQRERLYGAQADAVLALFSVDWFRETPEALALLERERAEVAAVEESQNVQP